MNYINLNERNIRYPRLWQEQANEIVWNKKPTSILPTDENDYRKLVP